MGRVSERVIELGDIGEHLPDDPWIVVFGGGSREGNRRARRAIGRALESDLSVVWFDGFGERWEDRKTSDRVPIDLPQPNGAVVVIDYVNEERQHWLTRLVEGVPLAAVKPFEAVERRAAAPRRQRVPILTPLRRLAHQLTGLMYKKVLRRIFLVFRGMVGWTIVREGVSVLSTSTSPPRRIIYCDDFALTIGWHAARVWPETPTSMELVVE